MAKRALITGITGQDGYFMAELLCSKGYEVHGLQRYDPQNDADCIDGITLHYGDMCDGLALARVLDAVQPDEIYNLAALSHVKVSFEVPASAMQINAVGTLNLLEAARVTGLGESVRIFQASSSEMFGASPAPQSERTPMEPQSPYAAAKLAAYHLARIYRDSYGMFVANGISFNHESPQRGEHFVTRKIARAVAEIEAGRSEPLSLGNLDSVRDWGYAGDYVEAQWLMLQQGAPEDYVLATGRAYSVREFAARAFSHIGVSLVWAGAGLQETGVCSRSGRVMVAVDSAFFRPLEVHRLIGDASKAARELGWRPKTGFDELVGMMVNAERLALGGGRAAWRMAG